MKTHNEVVSDGRIVVRDCSAHRKLFQINPTWVAFFAGVGIGKLISWVLSRSRKIDVESFREQVKLSKEITAVAQGPWGGRGGNEFYDGRGEIVGITVHYNEHAVTNLQVTYEQSGARFQGAPHGSAGGETAKISLNYPLEYLKQVVGTYAQDQTIFPNELVTSLTFITNKQAYGPYGHPRGQNFQTPATGVVGFYGRSGVMLDQLGVLTRH